MRNTSRCLIVLTAGIVLLSSCGTPSTDHALLPTAAANVELDSLAPVDPDADYAAFQQALDSESVEELQALSFYGISTRRRYNVIWYISGLTPSQFANQNRAAWEREVGKLDWDNNGCSVPGYLKALVLPALYSSIFRKACVVHDFGYRNVPATWRVLSQNDPKNAKTVAYTYRKHVDDAFRNNMYAICDQYFSGEDKLGCDGVASVFYSKVRKHGWEYLGY